MTSTQSTLNTQFESLLQDFGMNSKGQIELPQDTPPTLETIRSYFPTSKITNEKKEFIWQGKKIVARRKLTFYGMQLRTCYLHICAQNKPGNMGEHYKEKADGNFEFVGYVQFSNF